MQFVDISDEDEGHNASPRVNAGTSVALSRDVQQVLELLAARGVRPRADWLSSCLQGIQGGALSPEVRAERCFSQLLVADFNQVGAGVLPPDLHRMHKVELAGPFVLQVDEVSNVGCSIRDRFQEQNAGVGGRCLKLSMTDGVQRVFGIEYRPIPQMKTLSCAGFKIAVRSVHVRRGLLLLVPEIVIVLEGVVEQLEAARQRVVQQMNKPPRGNRNPRGTASLKLAEKATAAAWPSHIQTAAEESTIEQQLPNQGLPRQVHIATTAGFPAPVPATGGFPTQAQRATTQASSEQTQGERSGHMQGPATDLQAHRSVTDTFPVQAHRIQTQEPRQDAMNQQQASQTRPPHLSMYRGQVQENSSTESLQTPFSVRSFTNEQSSSNTLETTRMRSTQLSKLSLDNVRSPKLNQKTIQSLYARQQSVLPGKSTRSVLDLDPEPFTYLALLKKKFLELGRNQAGRIKCVLTGVKEFHFKDRDHFHLLVYIDDGSLITEALMHHQLVHKLVGYSAMEVTAALASTQEFQQMKDRMKGFQAFLTRFEGYMDVEFSETLRILNLDQSMQASDGWLLLDRVRGITEVAQRRNIDLMSE